MPVCLLAAPLVVGCGSQGLTKLAELIQLADETTGWIDCGVKSGVQLTRKDFPGMPSLTRGRLDFGDKYEPEAILDYVIDMDLRLQYDEMFEHGHICYPFTDRLTITYSAFKKQMGTSAREMLHLTYSDQVRYLSSASTGAGGATY